MSKDRSRPRTLVLVDDQPEFLQLARTRLTRGDSLQVVAEASSGQAVLDLYPSLDPPPEAILLDVEMPGLDGFETARRLRSVAPHARIILTSASESRGYQAAALGLGASFLPKRDLSVDAILRLID
jgi:DNA-binding NarL/FixJ family response regulator